MKKYVGYIVVFVFLIFIIFLFFNKKLKMYSKDLFYMDTYINIKFYCDDKNKAFDMMSHIDDIYREYHELTDRYNGYEGINNVYFINNNNSNDKEIVLDDRLYDLIKYAYDFGKKSNGLFDINLGGVIDVWKKYRDKGIGIPSLDELKKANKKSDIILLGDNRLLNNHPSIDLGGISKGYVTGKVGKYLEENGIKYYLINAGGNVLAGSSYNKKYYRIGIQSPDKNGISYILNSSNLSVVTSGGYERNYVYDGVIYHHIISPKTLFPTNYMKSVTVLSHDSGLSDLLSTTLFLMDVDSGKDFLKNYDAEAIWILNDNSIIKSEGFSSYEQE